MNQKQAGFSGARSISFIIVFFDFSLHEVVKALFKVIYSYLCFFFQRISQPLVARASLLYARMPLFESTQYKELCEHGFGILPQTASPLFWLLFMIV